MIVFCKNITQWIIKKNTVNIAIFKTMNQKKIAIILHKITIKGVNPKEKESLSYHKNYSFRHILESKILIIFFLFFESFWYLSRKNLNSHIIFLSILSNFNTFFLSFFSIRSERYFFMVLWQTLYFFSISCISLSIISSSSMWFKKKEKRKSQNLAFFFSLDLEKMIISLLSNIIFL